ncbi:uncharacterized protein KGF55_002969 [Candida pseudojiufengensis]|uniref:uncharacterized protein n=1 Tax=Candida pseudojiufengensis TaxID=497109 RepID=UPI0022257F8E|nr:uncharacterized protein KGF55_002969 [Candida pseudojiufengensis]KAI5963177.1 hypothetical protein KGF55_002969 [Candida pseudojiufengensis]
MSLPLKEYSPDTPRQYLLEESEKIIKSIPNWEKGKKYFEDTSYPVDTVHTTLNGNYWVARNTQLKNIDIEKFKKCIIGTTEIGFTHSNHELNYVHPIKEMIVENLKKYDDNGWSYIIHALYEFGFPLTKRFFNQLVEIYIANDRALIVSVPIKGKEDGVLGTYVSIEEIKWTSNSVDWLVATTSSAGGLVPDFLTKLRLADELVKDVPEVLAYINSKHFLVQVS